MIYIAPMDYILPIMNIYIIPEYIYYTDRYICQGSYMSNNYYKVRMKTHSKIVELHI